MRRESRKSAANVRGFLFCLASSSFYSVSLLLLRQMTNYNEVSADWTLCLKESVTVLCVGIFILVSTLRGKYRFPTFRAVGMIFLAGLFCELIGARSHLKSYALIGIVLAAPLMQSFQLIGTAGVGAVFLRERVTRLKALSIGLLILAVALLSFSPVLLPPSHPDAVTFQIPKGGTLFWGTFATLLAGLGYTVHLSILRSVLRRNHPESAVSEIVPKAAPETALENSSENVPETASASAEKRDRPTPISSVMFLVTLTGMIVFGVCLLLQRGPSGFWRDIPTECWGIVLTSGVLNLCGYYCQNRGIELVSAATGALVAVSQICLLTVFGILFFHESSNALVWLGLTMTVAGVILGGLFK